MLTSFCHKTSLLKFKGYSHFTPKGTSFCPTLPFFFLSMTVTCQSPTHLSEHISVSPDFAGHCVNLCSLAASKIQLGYVGAAGVPLLKPTWKQGSLSWHGSHTPLPNHLSPTMMLKWYQAAVCLAMWGLCDHLVLKTRTGSKWNKIVDSCRGVCR